MRNDVSKLGYYAALTAFIAIVGYGAVQLLQLLKVIGYPLADSLIYGFSLGIAPPFLMAILALHYSTTNKKRIWSHAALLFAVLYAVYVILMYTVQLAVVIPMSLYDPKPNILTVRPRSFFWTIDALGYICMGISILFAGFTFNKGNPRFRLRWFLLANGLMVPVISFVYFYPHFSPGLLLVASPWLITAPGSMILLARFFHEPMQLKPGDAVAPGSQTSG
jgi:hypothetical protein